MTLDYWHPGYRQHQVGELNFPALASPSTPALTAVTVKLPTFSTLNPEAWFQHAEAQFVLQNVTSSEMRYFPIVSALDAPTLIRVAPILSNFCTPHNYVELKTLLLETFSLSNNKQAHSFTSITELGDRRPSAVMEQMLLLYG